MASKGKFGGYLAETEPSKPAHADKPSISAAYGNSLSTSDFQAPAQGCTNLFEVFEASVKRFPDRPCLGKRIDGQGDFVWESYKVS